MRGEYFTLSLMNTERLQGGGDFVNPSVWLSTTLILVETSPQTTPLDLLPKVYVLKLRASLGSGTGSDSQCMRVFGCTLTQFFLFFFFESLSMLLPTLEWLVALLMLDTLSEECCLRMRRSAGWEGPFPAEPRWDISSCCLEPTPLSQGITSHLKPHTWGPPGVSY